ncbi:MAG: helix-turn-helix domain-containing protein [Clostridiales bacterium]|nr:helix-turn-helix domain-containing protein [Clostridiales bacterium]
MIDGQFLKKLREERKLSVRAFAKAVNSSPSSVSRWENQNALADFDSINRVANVLGVSVNYLLTGGQGETAATADDEETETVSETEPIAAPETEATTETETETLAEPEPVPEEKPAKKQLSLVKVGLISAGSSLSFFVILTALIVVCVYFQPVDTDGGEVHVWLYTTEEIFVIIAIVVLCVAVSTAATVSICYIIRKRRNK